MISKIRKSAASWIFPPILLACAASALTASAIDHPVFAGVAVLVVSLLAGAWTERRLRSLINAISSIASGDRYAVLPERIGGGTMVEMAAAAERMRQSLIDADALAVAHRSRESETKLHVAGRAFITQRFRSVVDELVST